MLYNLRIKDCPLLVSGNRLDEILGCRKGSSVELLERLNVKPIQQGKGRHTLYSLPEILYKMTFRPDLEEEQRTFDAKTRSVVDPGRRRAYRQPFMKAMFER